MTVSILFSGFIYAGINAEFQRFESIQKAIQYRVSEGLPIYLPRDTPANILDPDFVEHSRLRLQMALITINLAIFTFSGIAGYFLAGRTLKPIQEMLDEQNRFIADASHEFRTPLTALRTTMEVQLLDKDKLDPDTATMIESNLAQVETLQDLSNNLLILANYSSDKNINIQFTEVNLETVIAEALTTVTPLAQTKQIELKNDSDEGLTIKGTHRNLVELLVIFLDNAIKYSPENTQIRIEAEKNDHTIKLSIKDEGIGIPKEDIPHIFDRFYRSNKSRTKSESPGYGLGLSIAKKIIDTHKATVEVKSRPGKGSTFTLSFPRA